MRLNMLREVEQALHWMLFQEGRSVILEIQDHGIGIPREDLPRVFHPFYTGEKWAEI